MKVGKSRSQEEWVDRVPGRQRSKTDLLVGQQDQKGQLRHLYQGLPTLKWQGKKSCTVSTHNSKASFSVISANQSHTHSLSWDSCIACFSRFSRITLNCKNKNDQVQIFFSSIKTYKNGWSERGIAILTLLPFGPGRPMLPGWPLIPMDPAGPGRPSSPGAPCRDKAFLTLNSKYIYSYELRNPKKMLVYIKKITLTWFGASLTSQNVFRTDIAIAILLDLTKCYAIIRTELCTSNWLCP